MNLTIKWVQQLKEVIIAVQEGKVKVDFSNSKKDRLRELLTQESMLFKMGKVSSIEMKKVKEEIKDLINEGMRQLLKVTSIDFSTNVICPYHADNKPSMRVYLEQLAFQCFACSEGKRKDIIDIVSDIKGIGSESFVVKRKFVISLLGVEIPVVDKGAFNKAESIRKYGVRSKSYTSTIYRPVTEDEEAMKYLFNRGIYNDMVEKFDIRVWEYKGKKYICIPTEGEFWIRRAINPSSEYQKYWNKAGVPVELFNTKVLEGEDIIFVIESAIDAMILADNNFKAIALNSVSNIKGLIAYLEEHNENQNAFILLLDNDEAGINASRKLEIELLAQNKRVINYTYQERYSEECIYFNYFKDIGEAYSEHKLGTRRALDTIYQESKKMLEAMTVKIHTNSSDDKAVQGNLGGFAKDFAKKQLS